MKHLGDITKIDGGKIEPVDCITFGSPCTRLSVAGMHDGFDITFSCCGEEEKPHFEKVIRATDKYQYLYEMYCPICGKHLTECNESALFFHAVRIIEEMREATHGRYPAFAVWENVPGAFSSHKGEDFRAVLESLARISDPAADVPRPPKGKWRTSGAILGDGWSLAFRVHDAQFWGVPQRRRRIALVVDFGGDRASEILFDRRGLPGDSQESGAARQGAAAGIEGSVGIPGGALLGDHPGTGSGLGAVHGGVTSFGFNWNASPAQNLSYGREISGALKASGKAAGVLCLQGNLERGILPFDTTQITCKKNRSRPTYGDPCHPRAAQAHPPCVCIASGQANAEIAVESCPTLNCDHEQPTVVRVLKAKSCLDFREDSDTLIQTGRYVRRLIPVECERLQGYPDGWTDIGPWTDSKGKRHKESSDTARYTALGNSIALPFWLWLTECIAKYLPAGATLGSLFDGIGGFPLCWETVHGKGTARWASEIEEFPIAVTKRRLGKEDEI